MGFYGNITNTARTQFQFDKTYANRLEMDTALFAEHSETQTWGTETLKGDGIQIGRYVLVNYSESGDTDEYNTNYNIDKEEYGSQRGYDSTVWQKVYTNGTEAYVMVAELNTITPVFTIAEADAPHMVPVAPHFGEDSSNIFYKLHWSPTWGLRVKAASSALEGPVLTQGGFATGENTVMSQDETNYPSDERTYWHKTTYENGTINDQVFRVEANDENVGHWDNVSGNLNDTFGVPAAIYYNKDGFDPTTVSYGYKEVSLDATTYKPNTYYIKANGVYEIAKDNFDFRQPYYEKIEDHIQIAPTGYSGHEYNTHVKDEETGNYTTSVQPDTQELSIMLPAIGDTIAAVWDLIYGSEAINGSEKRNLDIKWESARAVLERKGLRLITDFQSEDGQPSENKYDYKVKNVETLAGAINSVHDLMGMIIIADNHDNLNEAISTLDENRIYYDSTNKTFNRKTKKYTFEPAEETAFKYVEKTLSNDTYAPGLYYIIQNGEYVIDDRATYTENESYYLKMLDSAQEYTEIDNSQHEYQLFDGTQYAYQDYVGTDAQAQRDQSSPFDYVRDEKFYEDKVYYLWDNIVEAMEGPYELSDEYIPNRYYYRDNLGNYLLSTETIPQNVQYYEFIETNVRSLPQIGDYDGLYLPGQYLAEIPQVDSQGNPVVDEQGNPVVTYEIDYSHTMPLENKGTVDAPNYQPKYKYYSFEKDETQTNDHVTYVLSERYEERNLTSSTYLPNVYYYKIGPEEYVKDQNLTWTQYDYTLVTFTEQNPYRANTFYYQDADNDNNWTLDNSAEAVENREYYTRATRQYYQRFATYTKVTNQTQYYKRGENPLKLYDFAEDTFFTKENRDFKVISNTEIMDVNLKPENIYVLRNSENEHGTRHLEGNDFDNRGVSAMVHVNEFYVAGRYYYEAPRHDMAPGYSSYVLDINEVKSSDRDYYKLNTETLDEPQQLTDIFEFYKYYEKVGDEYKLITSLENDNIPDTFYKRDKAYYVLEDLTDTFKKGAVWNRNIAIPQTVTLATRRADEDSYVLEPLPGFARDITTMHGLILKIKALLDSDNETTRDTRTVQGALNVLNDKIAQLDTWTAGQFIIVDDYGRFHGANIKGIDGMTVTVDSNPEQPSVIFGLNWDATDEENPGIDVGKIKLGNYSLNEENTGAIETGDTLKKALNKLENADVYQHPYDNEVEKTRIISEDIPNIDDLATQREYFWENYHLWLNDYNGSSTLYTYNLQDSTSLIVYQIDESIFDENDLASNIYTYDESTHTLIPVTNGGGESGELSIDYYDDTVAYYRPWEILLNEQFFPTIIGAAALAYNDPVEGERSLTTSELWQMFLDGEDYDPGTHSESHTETYTEIETLYEPYTLGDTVEKVLTLEENYFDENTEFEYEAKPEEQADSNTQIFWDRYNLMWNTLKRSSGTTTYYINGPTYRPVNITSETFMRKSHCYFDSQYHVFVFPLNYSDNQQQWYEFDSIRFPIILQFPMVNDMVPFKVGKGTPENIRFLSLESWLNIMDTKRTNVATTQITDPSGITQVPIYYRENDEWIQTDEYDMNRTYYITWQALFDALRLRGFSDIYTDTKEKAFKEIELTSTIYIPYKYYQKVNNEFILDAQNAIYDSTATYYELQNPVLTQEREVMNTSLLDICDLLYGVGSLYNTSTNVGVETETDSGIYTLPNMPGEWELIDKKFSHLISTSYSKVIWNDIVTMDHSPTSTRFLHIIRDNDTLALQVGWYNAGDSTHNLADDKEHLVFAVPCDDLGISGVYVQELTAFCDYCRCIYQGEFRCYWVAVPTNGSAEPLYAFTQETLQNLIATQQESVPQIIYGDPIYCLGYVIWEAVGSNDSIVTAVDPGVSSDTAVKSYFTPTVLLTHKQKLDAACNQFTWKRIS